jgi:hypothetical protein
MSDAGTSDLVKLYVPGRSLRVATYAEAARWLNAHHSTDARIAAPEIGALGYYWGGKILDTAGLVSPEAIPFVGVPVSERDSPQQGVIPTALIRATEPELVVTHPYFADRSLLADPWFQLHYDQIKSFSLMTAMWGGSEILVFAKNSQ